MGDPRPRQTFTRAQRLRRRPDFLRVQEGGARVTTRHLLILIAPRPDDSTTRLGVVASRKVGCAVQRNRAKRLLRDVFRRNVASFPRGVDVVVIVRPGVDELACGELEAEIQAVLPLVRKRASGKPNPGAQVDPRNRSGDGRKGGP
ncbi:ribonuclease P protein component [Polyangium sorediatum]|uniref:Ribonuclease P protein component n=1 Tax=Polyangium sorediatum TaxID=889274 RepID=A0ABT6NVM6_9BACT|nr:ribonuclease P protein component [Polyangium sorediatum]MDI1432389.1 ribonuclease P protein component [Polyangium sorediatum]